jgi:hypothetical protein
LCFRKPEECARVRESTEYFKEGFSYVFDQLYIALDGLENDVLFNRNMGVSDLSGVLIVNRYRQDPLNEWMVAFIKSGLAYGEVCIIDGYFCTC